MKNVSQAIATSLIVFATLSQTRSWSEIINDLKKLVAEIETTAVPPVEPAPVPDPSILVPEGANLQEALDSAPDGAILHLVAGATYTGNFVARKPVTIMTRGANLGARRVTPEDAPKLATIHSPNGLHALDIKAANVVLLEVQVTAITADTIVRCGDGSETTLETTPTGCSMDRVLMRGTAAGGVKRGFGANGRDMRVVRSHIDRIARIGQDTQAIGGWNGAGPVLIDDNYLEAAAENIMFGGNDPKILGLVPADITITNNHINKDPAWRSGTGFTVKNHIEFKAGRRIKIENNLITNTWSGGQAYSIVITASQYGTNPGVIVEDVLFQNNVIKHVPGVFNILGHGQNQDTRPTQVSNNIRILNNWFHDIDRIKYGGQGWFMMQGSGAYNIVVENNTIEQFCDTSFWLVGNSPSQAPYPVGFRFVGNLVGCVGLYGMSVHWNGSTRMRGDYWRDYFPGGVISGNAFGGNGSVITIFKNNLPENLHLSTTTGLIVDGYGTGELEPYGRKR